MLANQLSISEQINKRSTMYVATTIVAVSYLVYNLLPMILKSASDSLGLTEVQIGYLGSAYMLASGISNIIAVFWIRKINWKSTVAISLVAFALCYYAAVMVDYVGLLCVMFAIGFVSSIIISILYTCMADMKKSSEAFGFCIGIQVILSGIGFYLIPKYVTPIWGFEGIIMCLIASVVVLIPLLIWIPKKGIEKTVETEQAESKSHENPKQNKLLYMGFMGMFVYFVGQSGIWAFFSKIGESVGFSDVEIGNIFAITFILGSVGGFASGWIAGRMDRRIIVSSAIMLGVVSVMILMTSMAGRYWMFWLSVLFYGISWNLVMPFFMTIITEQDSTGTYAPLIPACQLLGSFVGPAVAGNIIFGGDYTWVFILAIVSVLISMILFVGVDTFKPKLKDH